MIQLLVHLLGDYVLQSDYMAVDKNKKTVPCLIHVILYTAAFLLLTRSPAALAFIGITHFLEDRFSLARYLIWVKNHLNPSFSYPAFKKCRITGYYDDWLPHDSFPLESAPVRAKFITTWLYIITDNGIHLACNAFALAYLT